MGLFRKKEPAPIPYDPAALEPALRSSICTGEMVVGFLDRETGAFREYELARTQADVDVFCKRVGAAPDSLRHIY